MKKKIPLIILISLLVLFGGYVLISFIVNKDGTMYWINQVIDWFNKPLPIVGVTALALLVFAWKVVVFIRETQPNKELLELREQHKEHEHKLEEKNNELEKQNQELLHFLYDICELSTNQKIKNYGKEHLGYGKETIDNEPKEEKK